MFPLPSSSYVTAVVTSLFLLTFPAVAISADGSNDTEDRPVYEPTAEQLELNERGVEALITGDYARSIALLSEAYHLGEVNILALNLGRAYQALGQCDEAEAKLELVDELPVVETPPAQRVDDRADDYLQEVRETCEDDVEASVDDAEELEMKPTDEEPTPEEVVPVDDDDWLADNQRTTGLYATGAGAVLTATAIGLHVTARHQRSTAEQQLHDDQYRTGDDGNVHSGMTQVEAAAIETRANRLDTASVATGAVGLLTLGVGTYLWLSAPDATPETAGLDFSIGDDRLFLRWSTNF